jgi:DNA-directed RNA polymerase specialized sigma24 family protein
MDNSPRPRGKKHFTQENLDLLLTRLHPNREQAGEEYVLLWNRLRLFFQARKCPIAEELADQTLTRVAKKLSPDQEIKNIRAFSMTVAKYIWLEYLANNKPHVSFDDPEASIPEPPIPPAPIIETGQENRCLEICLRKLSEEEAKLYVEYFIHDNRSNIDYRRKMASERMITQRALRLRIMRIRVKLEECLQACKEKNNKIEK